MMGDYSSSLNDINAFLDQVDRLEGEHKFMFQHLKPTQELLDLVQKMSDEELAVFSQFVVTTSSYHFGTENNAPPERPRPDLDAITTWLDA